MVVRQMPLFVRTLQAAAHMMTLSGRSGRSSNVAAMVLSGA